MGTQRLLNSTWNGRVGGLVAQNYKGKHIVKTTSLHNVKIAPVQRQNVRAFEKLNRLSAAVAKNWFSWLGIERGRMHRHNSVAHFFKPCVENHEFDIEKLSRIFVADGSAKIENLFVNFETGLIQVEITSNVAGLEQGTASLYIVVFDEDMNIYYSMSSSVQSPRISFIAHFPKGVAIRCCCFTSTKLPRGYKLAGWDYAEQVSLPIVENHIWYTGRMKKVNVAMAAGVVLYLSGNVEYKNGSIVYPKS